MNHSCPNLEKDWGPLLRQVFKDAPRRPKQWERMHVLSGKSLHNESSKSFFECPKITNVDLCCLTFLGNFEWQFIILSMKNAKPNKLKPLKPRPALHLSVPGLLSLNKIKPPLLSSPLRLSSSAFGPRPGKTRCFSNGQLGNRTRGSARQKKLEGDCANKKTTGGTRIGFFPVFPCKRNWC